MTQLSRRNLLARSAGATVAAAASAAVSSVPAFAASLISPGAPITAVAELLAEWHQIRAEMTTYERHLSAIYETMPGEFETGEGTPYHTPSDMPADLLERYRAWHDANYPADAEDRTDGLSTAMAEVEREIAATPAANMADVLLKLRLQATTNDHIGVGETISEEDAYAEDGDLENCLFLSALRDAERLVGKGGAA